MAREYFVYGGGFASGYFKDPTRHTNVVLKDEISPVLNSLVKHSLSDGVKATKHVAWALHKLIKNGIRTSSIDGIRIPRRKVLDVKGMMKVVARFKTSKIKKGNQIRKYFLRFTRRYMGDGLYGASLLRAVNYQMLPRTGSVVGWGSKTSPYWGAVVQKGSWGAPGAANKIGNQPLVRGSKQWRFLAAIGMLPEKGRAMKRQPAAFFAPFINRRVSSGWVSREMTADIQRRIWEKENNALARKTA